MVRKVSDFSSNNGPSSSRNGNVTSSNVSSSSLSSSSSSSSFSSFSSFSSSFPVPLDLLQFQEGSFNNDEKTMEITNNYNLPQWSKQLRHLSWIYCHRRQQRQQQRREYIGLLHPTMSTTPVAESPRETKYDYIDQDTATALMSMKLNSDHDGIGITPRQVRTKFHQLSNSQRPSQTQITSEITAIEAIERHSKLLETIKDDENDTDTPTPPESEVLSPITASPSSISMSLTNEKATPQKTSFFRRIVSNWSKKSNTNNNEPVRRASEGGITDNIDTRQKSISISETGYSYVKKNQRNNDKKEENPKENSDESRELKRNKMHKISNFDMVVSSVLSWNDKNKMAFHNYGELLKDLIAKQELTITEYQNELHNERHQMNQDLKQWKRWGQTEAENMARAYFESKFLLLTSKIELAMHRLQMYESLVNKVQYMLDGGDLDTVKDELFEVRDNIQTAESTQDKDLRKRNYSVDIVTTYHTGNLKLNEVISTVPIDSPKGTETANNTQKDKNMLMVSNESINYVFRDPEKLPFPIEVMNIEESIPTLIEVEQNLRQKYLEMQKKSGVKHSHGDRATVYRGLLEEALSLSTLSRSQGYHYHPKDEKKNQYDFNNLMTDDRYVEGKQYRDWKQTIIHKFEERMKNLKENSLSEKEEEKQSKPLENNQYELIVTHGKELLSSTEIVTFLQDMTLLILKEYPIVVIQTKNIDNADKQHGKEYKEKYESYRQALRLYLDRLVFPNLICNIHHQETLVNYPVWQILYTKEEREWDEAFNRNRQWMQELTQIELGIKNHLCKTFASTEIEQSILKQMNSVLACKNGMIHPETPYFEAIVYFHDSLKHSVPNDILNCFLKGVHAINSCAQIYSTDKTLRLCGDDYVDIMVWVIVHARIPDMHMRLGYLDRFVSDSIKFYGEVGMCLALVQQATQYIRDTTRKAQV